MAARRAAVILLLASCALAAPIHVTTGNTGAPVVIVPGLGGSVLEAKIDRESSLFGCAKKSDWFDAWLSVEEILNDRCLLQNFVIFYNMTTRSYHPPAGVEIRAKDFGGVEGITYLDPGRINLEKYFHDMVTALQGQGYTLGHDLFGAPYDWRLAPDGHAEYFTNLKSLIEQAVSNTGRRAVIVTHSMGCAMFRYFLLDVVDQDWVDANIASFVPIAGPFAGAAVTLQAVISGYNFGAPLPHNWLKPVIVSSSAVPWLTPVPSVFGDGTFVRTKQANYSISQLPDILDATKEPMAKYFVEMTASDRWVGPEMPANLTIHCIYGHGINTAESMYYDVDSFGADPPAPDVTYGDGDGTVNLVSLETCTQFAGVDVMRVPGVSHMDLVYHQDVIAKVIEVAQSAA